MKHEVIAALCQSLLAVLADVSVKSAILAAVAAFVLRLTRSPSASFQYRAWLVVLATMLALPVLVLLAPGLRVPVLPFGSLPATAGRVEGSPPAGPRQFGQASAPAPHAAVDESRTAEPAAVGAPHTSWTVVVLAAVYVAGAIASGLWLVIGLVLSRRRLRRRKLITVAELPGVTGGREAPVFECEGLLVPATIGTIRPAIFLPSAWRSWSDAKLRAVLAHEQAHVARGDYAVLMCALANRCLFWFHPVSWIVLSRLSDAAEVACDEAAVRAGSAPRDYARYLLEIASSLEGGRGRFVGSGLAMAARTQVARRIDALLELSHEPSPHATPRGRAVAASLVALASCLAVIRLVPSHSPEVPREDNREMVSPQKGYATNRASRQGPAPASNAETVARPIRLPVGPALATDQAGSRDSDRPAPHEPERIGLPPVSGGPPRALTDSGQAGALDSLSSPDAKVRERAVDAIGRVGDARAVLPLIRLLQDENSIVRQQAARVLGRLQDTRAVGPLTASLEDTNAFVREQAAESLGLLGARSAVEPLLRALGDPNANVRQLAARSLGRIGDVRAIPALAERERDPNRFVRYEASSARARLGGGR